MSRYISNNSSSSDSETDFVACRKPKQFTGLAADLPSWLTTFTNYAEAVHLKKYSWTGHALCYMPWTVHEFVSMSATEYGYATLPTFSIFTTLLYHMYCGTDPATYFTRLANGAKQASHEGVLAFGVRLYGYVKNTNLTTMDSIILFIDGLRNDGMKKYLTRKRLKNMNRTIPKTRTLQDYVDEASVYEYVYDLTPKTMVDAQVQTTEQATPGTQSMHLNTVIAGLRLIKVYSICFNCNSSGHKFCKCPKKSNSAVVQAKLAEARANNVRRDAVVEVAKRSANTNAAATALALLSCKGRRAPQ